MGFPYRIARRDRSVALQRSRREARFLSEMAMSVSTSADERLSS
jgi:hypothetical protein